MKMERTQGQIEGMEHQRYSTSQMGRMYDQEYSHLGGSVENWKYSRLGGMDGGLEMLKVRWQGCKIGITQGQVEGMRDTQGQQEGKYSRLVGRV